MSLQLQHYLAKEMSKVIEEGRGEVQEGIDIAFYMAGEGRRLFAEQKVRAMVIAILGLPHWMSIQNVKVFSLIIVVNCKGLKLIQNNHKRGSIV